MKFGSNILYTKTIKKSNGDNQSSAVHSPPGVKNQNSQIQSFNTSIDCKFYVLSEKYKNYILKINRKLPRGKIASEDSHMVKNEVFQIWPYYISIDCKFYVLSENIRTICTKSTETPSGQNSFNWYLCIHHCIDTVQYIWILLFCICSVRRSSVYIHT